MTRIKWATQIAIGFLLFHLQPLMPFWLFNVLVPWIGFYSFDEGYESYKERLDNENDN